MDFPGFGASAGHLEREQATAPALTRCAGRFVEAVALGAGHFSVAGHDIGGAVAQHLAASDTRVDRMALMNSVRFDSWPVPAVARFRDPELAASITVDEFLEARALSLGKAVARPPADAEREAWLAPWHSEDRVRSWTATAAAADSRFTLEIVGALTQKALPTLLVWGEEDELQPLAVAERYAGEIPNAELARIPGARHIPAADDPAAVAEAMTRFFG